jgi:hypothetical protein
MAFKGAGHTLIMPLWSVILPTFLTKWQQIHVNGLDKALSNSFAKIGAQMIAFQIVNSSLPG